MGEKILETVFFYFEKSRGVVRIRTTSIFTSPRVERKKNSKIRKIPPGAGISKKNIRRTFFRCRKRIVYFFFIFRI